MSCEEMKAFESMFMCKSVLICYFQLLSEFYSWLFSKQWIQESFACFVWCCLLSYCGFLIYFCVRGLPANLFPCDVYLCLVMLTNHVCSEGSSEYMLAVAVLSMYPGLLGLYSSGLRSEVKLILGNSHINSQTAGCSSEWNDINQKGNGSVSWF